MRYDDEEDPKKPRPVRRLGKGDNALESQEHEPYNPHKVPGKDDGRDHHRHVRC